MRTLIRMFRAHKSACVILFAVVVGMVTGGGVVYATGLTYEWFRASAGHSAETDYSVLAVDGLLMRNTSSADQIRTYAGADIFNMGDGDDNIGLGYGDDYLRFSKDQDAIAFGGSGTEDSIICFDDSESDDSVDDFLANSTNYIKVLEDPSDTYKMEIKADEVKITSDNGDVIIKL